MVILRSQNKITDFLMILAWASPFNIHINSLYIYIYFIIHLHTALLYNCTLLYRHTPLYIHDAYNFTSKTLLNLYIYIHLAHTLLYTQTLLQTHIIVGHYTSKSNHYFTLTLSYTPV